MKFSINFDFITDRLAQWYRHVLTLQFFRQHPLAASIPAICLKEPEALVGREVCVYMTHAPQGRFHQRVPYQIRAWLKEGFAVVLLVALDELHGFDETQIPEGVSGVLLRQNAGFDFAAWSSALQRWPVLRQAQLLALANDSCYGPLSGFDVMLQRARESKSDLLGCTVAPEPVVHLQCYLFFFKPRVLKSRAFRQWWFRIRCLDKLWVIHFYEIGMTRWFATRGFTWSALFESDSTGVAVSVNPTLSEWRLLIELGFPFIKVQLLRDRMIPDEWLIQWDKTLRQRGYPVSIIKAESDAFLARTGRSFNCFLVPSRR
ncbi:MAG: hypothetical protein RJA24_719 [Pseudomonadota bacterium]|jgi:lipopolysaccharide biosynthesis protein